MVLRVKWNRKLESMQTRLCWCRGWCLESALRSSCLLARVRGSLGTNLDPSQIKAGNSASLPPQFVKLRHLTDEKCDELYLLLETVSLLLSLPSSLTLSRCSSCVGTRMYLPFLLRRESVFPLDPKLLLSLDSVDSLAASCLAATRLEARKFSLFTFIS